MKKIFLTLLIFLFTALSSNAAYMCKGSYCRTGYTHLKPDLPNQIKDFPSLKKEWPMSDQNIYTPLNIKKT